MTNASEYQWTQWRGCKDIWAQASPWSEQHSVHGKAQHGDHGGSQTGSHPEGRSLQVRLVHVSADHREERGRSTREARSSKRVHQHVSQLIHRRKKENVDDTVEVKKNFKKNPKGLKKEISGWSEMSEVVWGEKELEKKKERWRFILGKKLKETRMDENRMFFLGTEG